MAIAEFDTALVGAWNADLTYTEGPRRGERERLRWTFLPDGVFVGTDGAGGELAPAVGEWTAGGDRFSFWLDAVRNDSAGRPTTIVHGYGEGMLAANGRSLTASGGSEVYSGSGEMVVANRADVRATRIAAA
jgi:hypothetical protein